MTAIGSSPRYGDLAGVALGAPIVDGVADDGGAGYWVVGGDGGVFAFGSARFFGSAAPFRPVQPIVALDVVQEPSLPL